MKKSDNTELELAHEHFKEHKIIFDVWRRCKQHIEPSNDLIIPLIVPYAKLFPEIQLGGSCRECFIDMLVWYNKEFKRLNPTKKNGEEKS
jgi:hypothetical protein